MLESNLATILIVLPLVGALVVAGLPLPRVWTGGLALLVALLEVAVWIRAVVRFDFESDTVLQLTTDEMWIESLGISYSVGFFNFSLWLAGASIVVIAAAIGYALWVGRDRPRAYYALMLLLTGAVVATFAAQDLLLFYVSFEAMLIPLYVLIGVWGGARRGAATLTFVIYTMVGSLLMLAAVVAYGVTQDTFSLTTAQSNETWIFLGFAVAFAIKAPLFPLHGWLPLSYREAPIEVTAVLSGVVSKTAIYGFLRIGIERFPEPANDFSGLILVLAGAGLVYGSVLAFRAPDLRGIVAYSSLAQMGLVTIGLFALNGGGVAGAILQSVNHALISAAMFLLVGMVERRCGTGELAALGGMARARPVLATVVLTAGMIALAVPGSTTFAGEFLIMTGVYGQGWGYAAIVALGIVLAAMYTLRLISAVLHVRPGSAVREDALDLRPGELGLLLPLVSMLLILSVSPALVSDRAFPAQDYVAFFRPQDPSP